MSEVSGVALTEVSTHNTELDGYSIGWLVLSAMLAVFTIIFAILWVIAINQQPPPQPPSMVCFGAFGVQAGTDANPLNQCGTNNVNPCVFAINSLIDAETQCNTLQSICNAFTFNFSTATMKIVNSGSAFTSTNSNLFVRQPSSTS
jgi:hypothetical protein